MTKHTLSRVIYAYKKYSNASEQFIQPSNVMKICPIFGLIYVRFWWNFQSFFEAEPSMFITSKSDKYVTIW